MARNAAVVDATCSRDQEQSACVTMALCLLTPKVPKWPLTLGGFAVGLVVSATGYLSRYPPGAA